MTDATVDPQTATDPAPRSAASLLYGDIPADPPKTPPQQQETKETAETETVEVPETETEEPDATTGTEGTEGNDPGEGGQTADGPKAPDASPSTIEDYDFGEGADWKTIQVPVKVDGKAASVPLADLVKSYQIGEAAEKRLSEANALKDQARQALETKEQELTGHFAVAAKLIEKVEKQLDADTAAVDWAKLRDDDPAEFSAKKAEIKERREQIAAMKNEARDSYQKAVAENQQQQQERMRELVASESEKLLEKLPEWQKPDTAKAEKAKIVGYLSTQGFDEKDIMGAVDHRLIIMARKAMLYDEGQTKVSVAKKKLKAVPKVLKPGATKPAQSSQKPRSAADILYGPSA